MWAIGDGLPATGGRGGGLGPSMGAAASSHFNSVMGPTELRISAQTKQFTENGMVDFRGFSTIHVADAGRTSIQR